ncbi:Beclin 1-associated autophagy-related key regulator [Plakobranchus ocellatus]|uniref:Beclin 1-associated autophagy-related key regulator n=1 Tax=Plakobranchus ocellatus TaxID=259542 RepID=A0AAV4DB96_9GAST|nr:Beclin 1-associated autophagy-related key regulator [Plakobranchus ocellatus]
MHWQLIQYEGKRREWLTKRKIREDTCRRFELEIEDIERANAKKTYIEAAKRKIIRLKKAVADTQKNLEKEKQHLVSEKKRRREARACLDHGQTTLLPDLKQKIFNLNEISSFNLPTLQDICQIEFNRDCDVRQLLVKAAKIQHHQKEFWQHGEEGSSIDPKPIPLLKQEVNLYHEYLALRRAQFVSILSRRIFPIEEVFARSDNENLEMSMATALKDACETAFIGGRWVHVDHKGENHCTIVGSTLPDYTGESAAVSLFLIASRYASDNPNKTPVGNASYGIFSALGYTVSFINLAAVVLDIPLPRKCTFRELKDDMQEPDFCNFVWRLHQNIMHLAYSQAVDPDHLVDGLSLQNILAMLRCPGLGRTDVFEPNYIMPVEAKQCLLEYENEEDEICRDWERVPAGLPSYEACSMGLSSPASGSSVDNSTSTAGAIFNTVNAAASAAATSAAATLSNWLSSYYGKK